MMEDALAAAKQAQAKLKAPSVKPGKYDLVLDPSHIWLTIHEIVGHPLELDRVLGYEANYAGTSFATLDKRKAASSSTAATRSTIVADKTAARQPGRGRLRRRGREDQGVGPDQRRQAGRLPEDPRPGAHRRARPHRTAAATPTPGRSVQFQRMPNVCLQPGQDQAERRRHDQAASRTASTSSATARSRSTSSATTSSSAASCSTRSRTARSPACSRTSPTRSTPRSSGTPASAYATRSDYRLGGSFFDGKGQPGQVSAVSHGSSTARFNGINVINTARSLG